jgi:hypothetical protein
LVAGHPILGDLQYKHHRKPECTAVPADIQQHLPALPPSNTPGTDGQRQQHVQMHAAAAVDTAELQVWGGQQVVCPSGSREGSSSGSRDAKDAVDGSSSSSNGGTRRSELLRDGTPVGTCLWAVQLRLHHPVTGQVLDISAEQRAAALYDMVCSIEAP